MAASGICMGSSPPLGPSSGEWEGSGSEGKKKTIKMTAQQLAAVILSTTEELKISALKKMTKSLRDQADSQY